eukprot:TCALIF_10014-PA protein Name:"Similar to Trafd1 TRAF-type zinc finger domain-containing protein 1 (Rattus norvegicus)" AED:0.02 eAED:0.03 QI:0/0.83/0.71/1/0.83/0.85/7/147/873
MSKRDIPLSVYTTHTAHCARNFVVCKDCGETIERFDMVEHKRNAHAIMVCDQCGVKVEARKLNDHRSFLCPKLLLVCKYCDLDVPASNLSEHECHCGAKDERCPHCEAWIPLRDLDKHMSQFHGLYNARSQSRPRREGSLAPRPSSSQTRVGPDWSTEHSTDTSAMLPCEFCEGLVPIHKLLEHQAECVNPSNVRGSSTLLSSPSTSSFASGLSRSQSMVSNDWLQIPNKIKIHRQSSAVEPTHERASRRSSRVTRQDNDDEPFQMPCHICNQMIPTERIERHQMTCVKMPDSGHAIRAASITRTMSAREARATTEDRTMRSVYRQSSFNDHSSFRRAESLSRQPSMSRPSRYTSLYGTTYSHDYVSASRRTTMYNGYSGFAMYNSISQGLDEISYGGRLSRRNSISDSRRTSTVTSPTSNADYTLPTLLATYEATKSSSATSGGGVGGGGGGVRGSSLSRQNSVRVDAHKSYQERLGRDLNRSESIISKEGKDVPKSRQDSCRRKERAPRDREEKPTSGGSIKRRVSFNDKESKSGLAIHQDEQGGTNVPNKPRRRKDPLKERKSGKSKKRDKSHDVVIQFDEKRKSQPVGDELFVKVSTKLKEVERERNLQDEREKLMSGGSESESVASMTSSCQSKNEENKKQGKKLNNASEHAAQGKVSSTDENDLKLSTSNVQMVETLSSGGHHNYHGKEKVNVSSSSSLALSMYESGYSTAASMASVPSHEDPKGNSYGKLYSTNSFDQDRAFAESSAGSSKATTSSEASPQQKPRQSRNTQHNNPTSKNEVAGDEPDQLRRFPEVSTESKSSSKRNSLDGKTVQNLAQDLAAECAKAYALMESSLSKLSTEFAVGPFGITPRQKKQRKSQTTSTQN